MIRRSVDLPQPDGPISDTNSPAAMSRSMPSSAFVTTASPRLNDLVDAGDPDDGGRRGGGGMAVIGIGRLLSASVSRRRRRAGRAGRRPRRRGRRGRRRRPSSAGDDDRRPQLLGPGDVVLVVGRGSRGRGRPAIPPGPSPMIAPDDARRRGDLEGGEQVRQRGGQAQLAVDVPARRGVRAHQLERARVERAQAADHRDRDREERQVRRDHDDRARRSPRTRTRSSARAR